MWFNDNVGNFGIAVCVWWYCTRRFCKPCFLTGKRKTWNRFERNIYRNTFIRFVFVKRRFRFVFVEGRGPFLPNAIRRRQTMVAARTRYKRQNCSTTERYCKSHFNGNTAVHKQTVLRFYRRVPGLESVKPKGHCTFAFHCVAAAAAVRMVFYSDDGAKAHFS